MTFIAIFAIELIILFFFSRMITRSVSSLLYRVTRSKNVTIQVLSFLFLPGTIIHELAHMLTASILFVGVGNIEFIPQMREGGEVKLGSVSIGKTDPLRRAVIGFAPVIVGTSILFGLLSQNLFPIGINLATLGIVYVVFEIANTMFSSNKDVEGTIELLIALSLLFLVLYYAGFRAPIYSLLTFIQNQEHLVRQLDILLIVPILLDALCIGFAKVVKL